MKRFIVRKYREWVTVPIMKRRMRNGLYALHQIQTMMIRNRVSRQSRRNWLRHVERSPGYILKMIVEYGLV